MTADHLPNWYEASLPTRERKTRGHFSTPPPLVEDILDACGYTPEQDLSQLRVLDPACGSGNFLIGATKRLMAFGQRARYSEQVIATSIQRNIWGFDPDPVACFLAEMHLHATCTNNVQVRRQGSTDARQETVRKGSAQGTTIGTNPTIGAVGTVPCACPTIGASPTATAPFLPLHIHQADALTLHWDENANIDLFLANPPYLAAKNNDLSGYRPIQGHGQIDSYLLFVQLALRVTRPYGWIGLVLPDPLLARINARQARQRLLAETTIHHLWHLKGLFTASVGAVVIVAQKCTPKRSHAISWQRERWSTFLAHRANQPTSILDGDTTLPTAVSTVKCVAQSLLLDQPHAELRYLLNEAQGTLVERLHNQFQRQKENQHLGGASHAATARHLRPLADFVTIKRGEEIGKEHPLLQRAGLVGSQMGVVPCADPVPNASGAVASVPCATGLHRVGTVACVPCATGLHNPYLPGQGISIVSQPVAALPHWYPVLRGGIDIKPYSSPLAQHWIPSIAVRKSLERYFTPKLLIIKSVDRLQATLDLQNHVVLQTLYMLHLRPQYPIQDEQAAHENRQAHQQEDELYFLLALLNSRLLQEYVYILHTAYKWVQPQIEQHVLAQLPIPLPVHPDEKAQISRRARLLMQACSEKNAVVESQRQYNELYEEQERAICALYTSALASVGNSST